MLTLSVVTPEGQVHTQSVEEVTVPGLLGEFGVLPGHIALLSAVKPGVLRYRAGADRGRIAIGPGFAEVDGKGAVVALVQKAVRADKIDRAAAEAALQEAEAKGKSGDRDAPGDSAWAQAQLEALKG
jgi:F-type H+-transporting ATPase subunit epsilon